MKYRINVLIGIFLLPMLSLAQPSNDFCLDAIRINDVTKYCSKVGEFSNIGATFDPTNGDFDKPTCWPNSNNDVWFRFVALNSDVIITINGSTLKKPEVALYGGSCATTIGELVCSSGLNNSNSATIYKGGLTPGTSYLIRVNSNTSSNGTFQLCVNNYAPPRDQNGDCATGAVLCDKSSFHVQSVTGFGFVKDEADNSCLDLNNTDPLNNQSESNSTWFKWTAKTSGTLSFKITPDVIDDDLDFALFEMNSLADCANKKLIRCVATGCENGKSHAVCQSQGCLGPTGLKDDDADAGENYNCDPGENGFAKSADIIAGKSYALIVNNYSSAGNGFFLEFGGTAEFLGPLANFNVQPSSGLKCDQAFTITDSSTFSAGAITKYTWNFGDGALPAEVSFTKGPNQVKYKSYGAKTIVLVVESDKGCSSVATKMIDVQPCCEDLPTLKIAPLASDLVCNGQPTGNIVITGSGGTPDYQFSFNNTAYKRQFKYNNLNKGSYTLKIIDSHGCKDSTQVTLNEPPPIIVNAGPDLKGRLGYPVHLMGSFTPAVTTKSIRWVPPTGVVCDSCLSTDAVPPGSTTYKLVITSDKGCVAYDSMFVDVSIDRALYVPNAFTPDHDTKNKIFKLYGNRAIQSIEYFRIFNRWGGLVYEGIGLDINDDTQGWDGTSKGNPQPAGVYAYEASVLFVDQIARIIKGDVTLLR